jgi:hypothetical protein
MGNLGMYKLGTIKWLLIIILLVMFNPSICSAIIFKGVNYTAWEPNALLTPESDASLAKAYNDGCNWIAICVWWFQDNINSTIIEPDYSLYSATPESLVHAIQHCHELGMKVMLKPMVDCRDGTWRGQINPSTGWFTAYQNFINFWADIAQDNNVELFCVGCELENTVSWSASWRAVVQNVRTHYSSPLTYAANHDSQQNVSWWDELSYIGIDAYYSLTASNDPNLDELKAAWNSWADAIESWRNTNWPSMDVIFTEVGYQSVDGTNQTPWWTDPAGSTIDMQEQADCYEALLSQCRMRNWWRGVFWWNWETNPEAGTPADPYSTPQNKLAELILRNYYITDHTFLIARLGDIDSGLTSPQGDYRWLDVNDQVYSESYRTNYNYTQANVWVQHTTNSSILQGMLIASNLKPNFAYQLKLVGTPEALSNEPIGFTGRWWQEEWNGKPVGSGGAWINGQNLNNKGNGSSPNPNDQVYLARKNIADPTSPTGKKYQYTAYLLFDYFFTDENGSAALNFEANSCYHVLFKTTQGGRTSLDGPLKTTTFDPNVSSLGYEIDYPQSTVSIFGEWERLPVGGLFLPEASYDATFLLTEESFHGTGDDRYDGGWAAAMGGPAEFNIDNGSDLLFFDDFNDGDYSGWSIVDEGTNNAPSSWSAASGVMVQSSNIFSYPTDASNIKRVGTYAYYAGGVGWLDYKLSLRIRSQDDDDIGVMFRYQDNNNYYRFSWDKQYGYRRLVKKQGGVFTLLASDAVAYVINQTYQLQIIAQGNLLQVSVDGTSVFSVTDTGLSSGSIALYNWGNKGSYFDNVVVEHP